jgi:hypothetical protein
MVSRTSNTAETTIAPGATHTIEATGEAFYFIALPSSLLVKSNLMPEREYVQGTGERMSSGSYFTRLELRNTSSVAVGFRLWYGFGEFVDSRSEILDGLTTTVTQAGVALAAGAEYILAGNASGKLKQRKAVLITNLDTAANLVLRDEAGAAVLHVFPQTNILLPISTYLKVKNETAAAVPCSVSEIWYTAR